jgi:ADP-ribose pyrophosphatase YjhB (NUDIX family)
MNTIRPNALVIIRKNNLVLAVKETDAVTGKIFYRLLGGGIEFGESSSETIKRELREEINATIINERLLQTIENVFEFNSQKGHEITFLYQGEISEPEIIHQEKINILDKQDRYAEWVPIEKIKNGQLILYPIEAVDYLI